MASEYSEYTTKPGKKKNSLLYWVQSIPHIKDKVYENYVTLQWLLID
jgi:hypothetical protein